MGNAIRWLKQEISVIPIDKPEAEAKGELLEKIDTYMREKIELSDKLIIQSSSSHISDNSTILTYGNSNVLKELFLYNHEVLKKKFQVIIIDSRPLFEGKKLAKELTNAGLKVKYSLINSISTILQDNHVDFVFLGAHAMLSNGFLYSRVGTALIAMKAKNKNIPVLVCCESIKFSDRVQLDSVTLNELGDSNELTNCKSDVKENSNNFALQKFLESVEKQTSQQQQQQQQQKKKGGQQQQKSEETPEFTGLQNWENTDYLNILNIMYDLTPPEYIQKIITEVGALPPSSVPVILREYKSQ
jgi:translation initiation factor eIF-2B subunit delta